jgi:hypothetical protein
MLSILSSRTKNGRSKRSIRSVPRSCRTWSCTARPSTMTPTVFPFFCSLKIVHVEQNLRREDTLGTAQLFSPDGRSLYRETGLKPFHCQSRNYATPRLSAEVAFVRPEKEEHSDWLVWPKDSFHWPNCLYCKQYAKSIQCFQKHAKLIENRFSRSKAVLTRVWELLTRRWNAWHWESHCVFIAGGERVNTAKHLGDSSIGLFRRMSSLHG